MNHQFSTRDNNIEILRTPEALPAQRKYVVIPNAIENLRPFAAVEAEKTAAAISLDEARQHNQKELLERQATDSLQPAADQAQVSAETLATIHDLNERRAREAVEVAQGIGSPLTLEEYIQNVEKAS